METFILMALAVPIVTAVALLGRRKSTAAWRETATALGFSVRRDPRGQVVLAGCIGSANVEVDVVAHERERKVTFWTRIRATGDIPARLRVGGEGFWREWAEQHGQDSVDRAGVAFDDHVIARGEIPEIFALLSGDTRAQFRELERRYRAFVTDGTVQVEQQGLVREPEALTSLVREVARLAMALSLQGPSLADRLGANVVTDGNALVRLRNLEVLLDRYPGTASAQLACEHAMGDRSYGVSILAARHCGPDGFPPLRRALRDEKASTDLRLQSLKHLAEHLAPDEVLDLLTELVATDESLKAAAVVALAEMGFDPGVEVLLDLLRGGQREGWLAFGSAVASLDREDLAGPLVALLDEEAAGDSLEFILGPHVGDREVHGEDEEMGEGEEEDVERLVIEIPADLRVDLDILQAAREALTALQIYPLDDMKPTELEPESEALEADEPQSDQPEGEEFGDLEPLHMEFVDGGESAGTRDEDLGLTVSEVELEAHAE